MNERRWRRKKRRNASIKFVKRLSAMQLLLHDNTYKKMMFSFFISCRRFLKKHLEGRKYVLALYSELQALIHYSLENLSQFSFH